MSNPFNGSKRGARGGVKNRPDWSRSVAVTVQRMLDTGSNVEQYIKGRASKDGTSSSPAMNTHFDGEETPEDYLIPRRSTSRKQQLAIFPQTLEFEEMKPTKRWQLATKGPNKGKLVETTEPHFRQVFKSDKTLLTRSKVGQFGTLNRKTGQLEDRVIRVTSHSKRKTFKTEAIASDAFEVIHAENELDRKPL